MTYEDSIKLLLFISQGWQAQFKRARGCYPPLIEGETRTIAIFQRMRPCVRSRIFNELFYDLARRALPACYAFHLQHHPRESRDKKHTQNTHPRLTHTNSYTPTLVPTRAPTPRRTRPSRRPPRRPRRNRHLRPIAEDGGRTHPALLKASL